MPKKKISKKVAKRAAKKSTAKAEKKVAKTSRNGDPKAPAAKKISAQKASRRKSPGTEAPSLATPTLPEPELVARTAYLLYLERLEKNLPGDEQSDWLAAEEALRVA